MSLDWLNPEDSQRVLDLFEDLLGIPPDRFDGYRFGRRGDGIYAVTLDAMEQASYLQWVSGGLRILNVQKSGGFRPTTRGLQVFGCWATRRVCDVDDAGLLALLGGASLPWDGEHGTVLLRWQGDVVGVGMLRAGQVVSQLPRSLTEHLQVQRLPVLC